MLCLWAGSGVGAGVLCNGPWLVEWGSRRGCGVAKIWGTEGKESCRSSQDSRSKGRVGENTGQLRAIAGLVD
jgi:hypothetical protein